MSAVYPFPSNPDSQGTAESVSEETNPEPSVKRVRQKPTTLLLRLALLNLLAFAMVGAAWWEGYVAKVIEADKTYLSVLIAVVFLVGLFISGWRAVQISREIDVLNSMKHALASATPQYDSRLNEQLADIALGSVNAVRLRLSHRIAAVRHIANVLVLLGLIGTVLGFIIALSGVNPDSASDVEGIAPMVSTLIQGMSTALYTTLIGSILNVWLSANYQMLASGTVELMSLWMEADDAAKEKADNTTVSHA